MTPEQALGSLVQLVGLGLVLWIIKRSLTGTEDRIGLKVDQTELRLTQSIATVVGDLKSLDEKEQLCRQDLPKTYANRLETKQEITKLWDRSDRHSDEISQLKGAMAR